MATAESFRWDEPTNWWHPAVEAPFRAFLEELRPEIVHFHALQSLGASLLGIARESGARVVVTMHDLWWICERQFAVDGSYTPCIPAVAPGSCACLRGTGKLQQRREVLQQAILAADLVLAPTDSVFHRLRLSGFRTPRQVVDRNGVAPYRGARRESAGAGGPLRLAYVGGSNRMKGVDVLVDALHRLAAAGVDFACDLYGVDDFLTSSRRSLRGLATRALPAFPPERLDEVLADIDAVVLPSVMFESSSRVAREALLRGVPVIATETEGPEEVVRHRVNGLLVPPADPEALAAAVAELAADRELLVRLTGAGPAGAVPTPEEQAAHLEELYGGLLRNAVPGPEPPARSALREVVYLAGIEGAPLRYRVHQPMEQLRLQGVSSRLFHYADPRAADAGDGADVVVVYRSPATRELLALIRAWRRAGKLVLFDVDDLIFDPELAENLPNLAALSPAERSLWVEGVRRYRATLLECGAALGSTPEIVRRIEALGLPARVHRNGVGTALAVASESARRGRAQGSGLRLGYFSGTDTHDHDLASVAGVLAEFLAGHPEASLSLGGRLRLPAELEPLGERVERLPFVSWHRLPELLARLDVNLAPLVDGVFEEAKSAIKWSEAALVDVPTIAAATEPFRAAVDSGRTGLLAASADEWRAALEQLAADGELRSGLGRAARRAAFEQGSPWLLGEDLLSSFAELAGARRPESTADAAGWPSESRVTALEAPGCFPSGAPGEPAFASAPLRRGAVSWRLTREPYRLRRIDVLTATYGARPQKAAVLKVRDRAGRTAAEVPAPAGAIGDNGWAAFELEGMLPAGAARAAEVESSDPDVAVWLSSGGRHRRGLRQRLGAPVHRAFYEPPVPPHFPPPLTTPLEPEYWSRRSAALAGRYQLYRHLARVQWRRRGPVMGTAYIARGFARRVLKVLRGPRPTAGDSN